MSLSYKKKASISYQKNLSQEDETTKKCKISKLHYWQQAKEAVTEAGRVATLELLWKQVVITTINGDGMMNKIVSGESKQSSIVGIVKMGQLHLEMYNIIMEEACSLQ